MQQFYEVILILGGPRLAAFEGLNLGGPDITSCYRWRNEESINIDFHDIKRNMSILAEYYKKILSKYSIKDRIPVLTGEDETAIKSTISYDQKRDQMIGFCGEKCDDIKKHHCEINIRLVIGDDDKSYWWVIFLRQLFY